jgi:hypothetical protein
MVADFVTFASGAGDDLGVLGDILTYDKECGFYMMLL